MSTTETYERVTANILALVEKSDLLPWQKSWKGSSEVARSMSSGKLYNGINRWILTLTAQANGWSPWFGTYEQIKAQGGQVRKGEKSSMAILWKPMKKMVDGVEERFLILRSFNVFSASQAEGLPEKFYNKPEPQNGDEIIEDANTVLKGYLEREIINVTHTGDRAFYRPGDDSITLPPFEAFQSADHYYATAFHECVHSTGHKTRLDRPEIQNFHHFGDDMYSREELVAEMGSALLMGVLNLDKPSMVENQAAYLKHWKSKLVSDPQALVWAAGRAEKAANRILGVEPEVKEESAS